MGPSGNQIIKFNWVFLFAVFVGASAAQESRSAEIFRCTSWTNSSLLHRGPVTIAIDAETLTWRANTASGTARSIVQGKTYSAYANKAHVFFVFGSLFFELGEVAPPLFVRRVPFVKNSPRISEIECS